MQVAVLVADLFFREWRIMTVPSVYIFQLSIYARKNLNSFGTLGDHHDYLTRHRACMEYPRHRTTAYERSPLYSAVKIYNKLPHKLKILQGKAFEVELRKLLIRGVYYTLGEFYTDTFVDFV